MAKFNTPLFMIFASLSVLGVSLIAQTSANITASTPKQASHASKAATMTMPSHIDPLDEGRASATHKGKNPHSSLTPQQHIEVALQHYKEGRTPQAMVVLSQAIDRFPDSSDLYAVRSSLYLQENKTTDALSDIEQAIKLNPENPLYYVNRSLIYLKFKREKDALADLDKAIEMNPELLPAYFNRGSLLTYQEKYTQALADFDKCIALQPHLPGPYFNRGSIYHTLGKNEKAKKDIERFVQIAQEEKWKKAGNDLLKAWADKEKNSHADSNKDDEQHATINISNNAKKKC